MPTCSFCKRHYEFPRGLTIFQLDGKTIHFCSSKCRRNNKLKRDPRKVNWVKRQKKASKSEKTAEELEKIKDEVSSETKSTNKN
ncbi:MAG: 50S ribosomal protein L24 [Candidatus Nanoarchaeia archaeon]|nr:50S ribosomal protein L24 [Candidatus Nanoarchaeia archaeon]MDD5740812.1 50S ribosomal protein L24 [Candidatus Nanoarchaeia archaeon]